MLFALITDTKRISQTQLYGLSRALERNGKHCAQAWGKEPPAVVALDRKSGLPRGASPILFVDENSDPTTLAYHYYDPIRGTPASRVLVHRDSKFNDGNYSLCEAASHEMLEALLDPMINLWVDHPDPAQRADTQMAFEICDMTQEHYTITMRDVRWRVADFVTPAYFRQDIAEDPDKLARAHAAGVRFNYCGTLSRPGEIGPEGYAILRQRSEYGGWRVWSESKKTLDAARVAAKAHPLARTFIRGVRFEQPASSALPSQPSPEPAASPDSK
jgi:hypothetical protein